MTVSCPLATVPPFGTAGVEGSRVSHDLDGISPVPVVFSMCRNTDSAAVCACIRQETIVHEVGSLPDFFNGNGVFPVVDDSLSGFVGIVIKRLVESGLEVDGPEWVGRIRKGVALAENGPRRLGLSASRTPCCGVLLRPRSVSFGGPWFAFAFDSAALLPTPAVAGAMMNASKAPDSCTDAMIKSSDCNVSYFSVSLFIGDRTPFGTVHGRRVLSVTRPGRS